MLHSAELELRKIEKDARICNLLRGTPQSLSWKNHHCESEETQAFQPVRFLCAAVRSLSLLAKAATRDNLGVVVKTWQKTTVTGGVFTAVRCDAAAGSLRPS